MASKDEVRVVVDSRCELGEGPIWHPERESLLWCDIYAQVLFETDAKGGPL
jgi:sugar lactone lactonase YvrE